MIEALVNLGEFLASCFPFVQVFKVLKLQNLCQISVHIRIYVQDDRDLLLFVIIRIYAVEKNNF